MGCAARSRQGVVGRVSEQRAHSIGSAAAVAPVAPLVRVLSSAISSTMCAASDPRTQPRSRCRRGGGRGSSTDGSGCRWCRRARASCMRHGGQGSAGTGRRGGLCRRGPLQSEALLGCAFCTARRGSRPRGRGRDPRLFCGQRAGGGPPRGAAPAGYGRGTRGSGGVAAPRCYRRPLGAPRARTGPGRGRPRAARAPWSRRSSRCLSLIHI